MSELKFTFKGRSSDNYGIDVTRLPNISRAQIRDDSVTVPGRSGAIHLRSGHMAYEEIYANCSCYLNMEEGRGAPLDTIRAWLTGDGDWTQSDMPGVHYKAHILDQIDMQPWVVGFKDRLFNFTVLLEPFAYADMPRTATVSTSGSTVRYDGTVYAEPRITITATGDFELTWNGMLISVSAPTTEGTSPVVSTVVIDSELMECFEADGTTFANSRVTMEDFPTLEPGDNTISWTGSVSSVSILERVRYL